jgi:hypothetical protein
MDDPATRGRRPATGDAFEPSVWREVVSAGLSVAVLEAAEAGGCRGVVTLLEAAGMLLVVDVERGGQGPPRLSVGLGITSERLTLPALPATVGS